MTAALIAANKLHWADQSNFKTHWTTRAQVAASLIPAYSVVCDLGCGPNQDLKRHLRRGCRYLPCDMTVWSDGVEYCELNEGVYPERHAAAGNIASLLGVIEYLSAPEAVFAWLAGRFDRVVFSYNPRELFECDATARHPLWVNALSTLDLLALTQAAGFDRLCIASYMQRQHVFLAYRDTAAGA